MKILFFLIEPYPSSAKNIRIRSFIRILSSLGHKITIVAGSEIRKEDQLITQCDRVVSIPFFYGGNRLKRFFKHFISFPDPSGYWVRSILKDYRVQKIVSDVHIIFVSTPPHGLQKVGIVLSESYKIPYVADLRDDWIGNHRARFLTLFHKKIARKIEKKMVKNTSLIIANSTLMRKQFLLRYPEFSNKVITLTNGFNEIEFKELGDFRDYRKKIRIGYFGSNYNGYVNKLLVEIAMQFMNIGQQEKWQICAYTDGDIKSYKLPQELLTIHPLLPSDQSIRSMNSCDVLLLLMPPGERDPSPTVPLKAYSYLRTGLPIVYCGERGATSDLLKEFNGTFSMERCCGKELGNFLNNNLDEWEKLHKREGIYRYSFEYLGRKLEGYFNQVVSLHSSSAYIRK